MAAPTRRSMWPKISDSPASMFTFSDAPALEEIMKLHDFKGVCPPHLQSYTWAQHLEQKLQYMIGSCIHHVKDDPLTAAAVERALVPWVYQDKHMQDCWNYSYRNITTVYLTIYVFNKLTQYHKDEEDPKPDPRIMMIRGYNPVILKGFVPKVSNPSIPLASTAKESEEEEDSLFSMATIAKTITDKTQQKTAEHETPEPHGKLVQVTWLNPWGSKIVGEDSAITVPDGLSTLSALVALLKKDAGITLPEKKFLKQFGIIGHIEGTGKTVLRSNKRFLTWRDETLAKAEGPVHLWVGMANPRFDGPLAMQACVTGAGGAGVPPYHFDLRKPMDNVNEWSDNSIASRPGSVAGDTTPPSVIDLDMAMGYNVPATAAAVPSEQDQTRREATCEQQ